MVEKQTCPQRAVHGLAGSQHLEGQDEWREDAWDEFPWSWQPRRCSFCGSLHPEDTIRLVLEGWEDEPSTKQWKGYLHPPGYTQVMAGALRKMDQGTSPIKALEQRPSISLPSPPAKFYGQHFAPAQLEELNAKRSSKPD